MIRRLAAVLAVAILLASGGTAHAAGVKEHWKNHATGLCLDGEVNQQHGKIAAVQRACSQDAWTQAWTEVDLGGGYWMLETWIGCLRNADGRHPENRFVFIVDCDRNDPYLHWRKMDRPGGTGWVPKMADESAGPLCLTGNSGAILTTERCKIEEYTYTTWYTPATN